MVLASPCSGLKSPIPNKYNIDNKKAIEGIVNLLQGFF
jgi:hypothetical protein